MPYRDITRAKRLRQEIVLDGFFVTVFLGIYAALLIFSDNFRASIPAQIGLIAFLVIFMISLKYTIKNRYWKREER